MFLALCYAVAQTITPILLCFERFLFTCFWSAKACPHPGCLLAEACLHLSFRSPEVSAHHITSANRSEKFVWAFLETFPSINKGRATLYRVNLVLKTWCLHYEMSSWSYKCQLPSWDHEAINPSKNCHHVTGVKFLGHTRWVKAWKYVLRLQVLC